MLKLVNQTERFSADEAGPVMLAFIYKKSL